MTADFDIQPPTRLCAATGQPLGPGERFYAVLREDGARYARTDYAAAAWAGPPAGCVAFWAGRVPAGGQPRRPTFPEDLLVDWFHHLAGHGEASRVNLRYVVALLLMRRKRLKFEDATKAESGEARLVVRDARTGARHDLADPRLGEAEVLAVQGEIFRVLGWE